MNTQASILQDAIDNAKNTIDGAKQKLRNSLSIATSYKPLAPTNDAAPPPPQPPRATLKSAPDTGSASSYCDDRKSQRLALRPAERLHYAIRTVIDEWVAKSNPETFRVNRPIISHEGSNLTVSDVRYMRENERMLYATVQAPTKIFAECVHHVLGGSDFEASLGDVIFRVRTRNVRVDATTGSAAIEVTFELASDALRSEDALPKAIRQSLDEALRAMIHPRTLPRAGLAHYGKISFADSNRPPANFIHLADSREPFLTMEAYGNHIIDLMEKNWHMNPASVLISVTGGAQDFPLKPRVRESFRHGLAKAASSTSAWVFTGGTDSGVMSLVGRALYDYRAEQAHIVGCSTWQSLWGRNQLLTHGGTVSLAREHMNDRNHANLEPHHTEFLLVDNGVTYAEELLIVLTERLKLDRTRYSLRLRLAPGSAAKSPALVDVILGSIDDDGDADESTRGTRRHVLALEAQREAALRALSSLETPIEFPRQYTNRSPLCVHDVGPVDGPSEEGELEVVLARLKLNIHSEKLDECVWGGEIQVRELVERLYCARRQVPRVMLVLHGGPGTLSTVLAGVRGGCPVVLVADSGGAASALADYLQAFQTATGGDGAGDADSQAEMDAWYDKYAEKFKDEGIFREIAELNAKPRQHGGDKVSFFSATKDASASLDLHILNAVIDDDRQTKPGSRLHLAVQWNRIEVVSRVLQSLRDTPTCNAAEMQRQISLALQVAIEKKLVGIIKVLFEAQQVPGSGIDFLSLYGAESSMLRHSDQLQRALTSDMALKSTRKVTTLQVFREVLGPFLKDFVPGMDKCLDRELAAARADVDGQGQPRRLFGNALPHLLFWATLIGEKGLARVFWEEAGAGLSCVEASDKCRAIRDPIRLALLASETSRRSAEKHPTATQLYLENAATFESWACAVLEKCESQDDATSVLMRSSDLWPGTILSTAVAGEHKEFTGHRYVQTLIDGYWRGNIFGSVGALPAGCTDWQILTNIFWPRIKPEAVGVNKIIDRRLKNRSEEREMTGLTAFIPYGSARRHRRQSGYPNTPNMRSMRSIPLGSASGASDKDANSDAFGGALARTQAHLEGLGPIGWPFLCALRCGSCAVSCLTLCNGCEPCREGLNNAANIRWFFAVPRVKYTLKLASYATFLALYALTMHIKPGNLFSLVIEAIFFTFCVTFWLEEMHQWYLHSRLKIDHFDSWANVVDVASLSSLVIASFARMASGFLCGAASFFAEAVDVLTDLADGDEVEARRLADVWLGGAGRLLLGGHGGSHHSGGSSSSEGGDAPLAATMIEQAGCSTLWFTQAVLSINAVVAFFRVLVWLQINHDIGVLSIILKALTKDIATFILILVVAVCGFETSFMGLMPWLGGDGWGPEGSFGLPFWAMYGEFGDLVNVAEASKLGPLMLWLYSFVTQVVLLNLLIAMMSETYERIKQNAHNEWKFSRIIVVEEFVASVYWLPPPISAPFLLMELLSAGVCSIFSCCHRGASAATRGISNSLTVGIHGGPSGGVASRGLKSAHLVPSDEMDELMNSRGLHKELQDSFELSREHVWAMGYSRDARLVPLLSGSLPAHEMFSSQPDVMWIRDLLDDEAAGLLESSETKIDQLTTNLSTVMGQTSTIQESISALWELLKSKEDRERSMKVVSRKPLTSRAGSSTKVQGSSKSVASRGLPFVVPGSPASLPPTGSDASMKELRRRTRDAENAATAALSAVRQPHVKARGAHPSYPKRTDVTDALVPWHSSFAAYAPVEFTHANVLRAEKTAENPNGWADPPNYRVVPFAERNSHEGVLLFGVDARPMNPRGRTGIRGRGLLGKWGPNHAADPLVTRWAPSTRGKPRKLQFISIKRSDTGDWALPGGMVDDGELVTATVKREFTEEAGCIRDPTDREDFNRLTDELFAHGQVVYKGYVDDPRNTDNAWMETVCFHFHCSVELGRQLPLRAGDDATSVRWLDVDPSSNRFAKLYASHRQWVEQVARRLEEEAAAAEGRSSTDSAAPGGSAQAADAHRQKSPAAEANTPKKRGFFSRSK